MKRLWISLALLLGMFALSLWSIHSIHTLSDQLVRDLKRAEVSAEAGDWTRARQITLQARKRWERSASHLYMYQCHATGDEINSGFRQTIEYLQWKDVPEYSATNGALIANVEHLAEMETLNLRNLL